MADTTIMRFMDEKHITQLETRLEQFIEGAFTSLFHKRISSHDIAVKLARSMEGGLLASDTGNPRPIAPDRYAIHVPVEAYDRLSHLWANLADVLKKQMVELATISGYRLAYLPTILLIADGQLHGSDVRVSARHSQAAESNTQAMQPMNFKPGSSTPKNPQFIINGQRNVQLSEALINIGRSDENHIMIDDYSVSRHHLQVRLRFGTYTIFDVNSRGGTFVNGVQITEHRLQPGDVIRIGNTQIIYMTDDDRGNPTAHTTQTLEPVDN